MLTKKLSLALRAMHHFIWQGVRPGKTRIGSGYRRLKSNSKVLDAIFGGLHESLASFFRKKARAAAIFRARPPTDITVNGNIVRAIDRTAGATIQCASKKCVYSLVHQLSPTRCDARFASSCYEPEERSPKCCDKTSLKTDAQILHEQATASRLLVGGEAAPRAHGMA